MPMLNRFGPLFGSQVTEEAGLGTVEDLRRKRLEERLNLLQSQGQTIEPKNTKKIKKQDFFSILPLMAAALTSKTSGDLAEIVSRATGLLAENRSERAVLEEEEKKRTQRAREVEIDTILRELDREDTQEHQTKLAQKDIEAADKRQKIDIEARNKLQAREFEFQGNLQTLRNNHDRAMLEARTEEEKEVINFRASRELAESLASSGVVDPDKALDISESFYGIDGQALSELGVSQMNLWANLIQSKNAQERQLSIADHLVNTDKIEIPVYNDDGTQKLDFNGKPIYRKLTVSERLSMFSGGIEGLIPLLSETTPEDEMQTTAGGTVKEVKTRITEQEAASLITKDDDLGKALKESEQILLRDWDNVKAAELVRSLIDEFGDDPKVINSIVDSFSIDNDKKRFMKTRVKAETSSLVNDLSNLFMKTPDDTLRANDPNISTYGDIK